MNCRSNGSARWLEHLGQHLPGRLALGVTVAVLLDDGGVDAQRDVVHEEAVAHRAVVDEALDAVAKGDHALARVFLVEAQVLGEMVARAGRDADERDVVLVADRGDEGLRPVAAGHAQAVGAAGDGVAGQNGEVEAVVEKDRLDAHLGGDLRQAELRHLAAARPRVAQEHRLARGNVAHCAQPVEFAQVGCERGASGQRRDGQRRAGGGDPHERALGALYLSQPKRAGTNHARSPPSSKADFGDGGRGDRPSSCTVFSSTES